MIQKKICMLGGFSVGKTSLVQRFVKSIFSEKYHSTIGVKVDKKSLTINGTDINLILWDIHGEEEYKKVQMSYLRGCAGYLLVVDGTRAETLQTALTLRDRVNNEIGNIPFILVMNKCDLQSQWTISPDDEQLLLDEGITILKSSAKSGEGVEEAFQLLAERILL